MAAKAATAAPGAMAAKEATAAPEAMAALTAMAAPVATGTEGSMPGKLIRKIAFAGVTGSLYA